MGARVGAQRVLQLGAWSLQGAWLGIGVYRNRRAGGGWLGLGMCWGGAQARLPV